MQAPLRLSKNNLCNDLPQSLTWSTNTTDCTENCPYTALERWWKWCGKPKKGFIFAQGNGEVLTGNQTLYQVQTKAKELGVPNSKIPRKHSARVTTVLTLEQMKVSKRRIMRNMNWRSDKMINYYLNRRDMLSKDAPPMLLANMSSQSLNKIQKSLR